MKLSRLAFPVALTAALVASAARPRLAAHSAPPRAPWPAQFQGRALTRLASNAREERLGSGFQGALARFSDGRSELIVRQLDGATRGFHSAIECYRGLGFAVHALPDDLDEQGHAWSAFEAVRGAERLRVRERLEAFDGSQAFPDPADWFWQAALGRAPGPYWSWTVVDALADAR